MYATSYDSWFCEHVRAVAAYCKFYNSICTLYLIFLCTAAGHTSSVNAA